MRSSTCTSRRSARSDAEKNRLRRGQGRFEETARQPVRGRTQGGAARGPQCSQTRPPLGREGGRFAVRMGGGVHRFGPRAGEGPRPRLRRSGTGRAGAGAVSHAGPQAEGDRRQGEGRGAEAAVGKEGAGVICSRAVILGLDPRIRRWRRLCGRDGPAGRTSPTLHGAPDGLALGSSPRVTVGVRPRTGSCARSG